MENQNEIREETIEIKGMRCKSCAEEIERRLLQLKGVSKAKVSFTEEKAHISYDPTQINIDDIKREIERMGYRVGTKNEVVKSPIKQGIIYGIIPHTTCIAYILASVLGATIATQFLKPLLLNPYFFYLLIFISLIFATVSAVIYLKRQGFITFNKTEDGLEINFSPGLIRRKWKYLSTLYGATIGVNLLFLMVIFPLLANVSVAAPSTDGNTFIAGQYNNVSSIKLKVDIPCPGHAPLIQQELRSIDGVLDVKYTFPDVFDVKYDPTKTSKQQILSLEVFKTYRATILEESNIQKLSSSPDEQSIDIKNVQTSYSNGKVCGCRVDEA